MCGLYMLVEEDGSVNAWFTVRVITGCGNEVFYKNCYRYYTFILAVVINRTPALIHVVFIYYHRRFHRLGCCARFVNLCNLQFANFWSKPAKPDPNPISNRNPNPGPNPNPNHNSSQIAQCMLQIAQTHKRRATVRPGRTHKLITLMLTLTLTLLAMLTPTVNQAALNR